MTDSVTSGSLRAARRGSAVLAGLVVLVCVLLALPSVLAAREASGRASRATEAAALARLVGASGALLRDVQVERGTTAVYVSGRRPETAASLETARAATDEAVRSWEAALAMGEATTLATAPAVSGLLADLPSRRAAATDGSATVDSLFAWYTELTNAIIVLAAEKAARSEGEDAGVATLAYTSLLTVTEQLGQERGRLGGLLESGRAASQEAVVVVARSRAARNEALTVFRLASPRDEQATVDTLEASPAAEYLEAVEEAVLAGDAEQLAAVDPDEWFSEATTLLDGYAALLRVEEERAVQGAQDAAAEARATMTRYAVLAAVVVVAGLATGLGLLAAADRRVAEQAREARRRAADDAARIEALLTGVSDAIVIATARGVIEHANPRASEVFGYPSEELIGANISMLMPGGVASQHDSYLDHYAETGQQHFIGGIREVVGLRRDGSEVPLEVLITTMEIDGRTHLTGVLRDVSERHRMSRELAERATELASKNEALERSNDELQQFAYVASHDLQEPLRKVASYVELLEADYGDQLDDDAREYIAYAADGARRMRVLIQDLLALSRVRRERMVPEDCDTGALVQTVLDDLELAIRDADATVTVGELPVVPGDPGHLRQVFQNLLSNAVKYRGERRPEITVSARPDGTGWRFAVADNGIGFKQEYAEQVFGMFQRLVSRRQYEGTGIGLAIVAKIVHNHGGRIWVTSEPRVGTTFELVLPGATAPARAGDLPPARQGGRAAESLPGQRRAAPEPTASPR